MDVELSSDLEVFLASFRGRRVLFAPNPSNAGDSVIACAEYQLFERLGIDYKVISLDVDCDITAGEIVFYGGGGNLVEPYPNARNFIARHHRRVKRLVVLPHTVLAYSELLSAFGDNVDLICREQSSYDYALHFAHAAQVYLMDDAAFLLDVKELSAETSVSDGIWFNRPLRAAKRAVRIFHHSFRNRRQGKTLNSFRGDVEGTGRSTSEANFDVSQMLAADTMSALDSTLTARSMIKFISRFSVVKTDRLHVCIVSLLLGKEVHFFDNSYGKNRAVYEKSMCGRFPSLKWCE